MPVDNDARLREQSYGASPSSACTRYLSTGREWDEAVRLWYDRARSYDPFVGRFTSEDSLGLAAGDAQAVQSRHEWPLHPEWTVHAV